MRGVDTRQARLAILLAVAAVSAIVVAFLEPIAQLPGYHVFADQRRFWGIPNFWNVVSSLPFLAVGLAGTRQLLRQWPRGALLSLRPAYLFFFISMVLVAIGSTIYHLDPTHDTLVWDRLPIAVSFMAFFSVIVGEHINPRFGGLLLWPLLACGLVSVAYWYFTEAAGRGDLRLYIIVQYLPLALIPLIILLFPSEFPQVQWIWAVLGAYGAAKLLELADEPIFSVLQFVSGHTLKHLLAALSAYLFLLALKRRCPVTPGALEPPSTVA